MDAPAALLPPEMNAQAQAREVLEPQRPEREERDEHTVAHLDMTQVRADERPGPGFRHEANAEFQELPAVLDLRHLAAPALQPPIRQLGNDVVEPIPAIQGVSDRHDALQADDSRLDGRWREAAIPHLINPCPDAFGRA